MSISKNQEAFNKVWKHFVEDKKPQSIESLTVDGGSSVRCVYRAGEDPKSEIRCAIGLMIPDEEYKPEFDHSSLMTVKSRVSTLSAYEFNFLDELQKAHDFASMHSFHESIEARLRTVAEAYNLDIPKYDNPV